MYELLEGPVTSVCRRAAASVIADVPLYLLEQFGSVLFSWRANKLCLLNFCLCSNLDEKQSCFEGTFSEAQLPAAEHWREFVVISS